MSQQNKMKRTFLAGLLGCALALTGITAYADEGMWMAPAITPALEKIMQSKGLELSAGEIFSDEGTALCDAVVSLDFGCSGSIISDNGLVITNHHCAYSDVYALSTPEHNYLEDGFWAFKGEEEVQIPGKRIQILKKVLDVTDEVNKLMDEAAIGNSRIGSRKLSYLLEKKYKDIYPDFTPSLDIMWAGSKYYLALYREYDDIRLVAAPPVSIAAFGGDIDNWEWPQHKGDFALYRIYENGEPLKAETKLDISRDGYGEGDFAMVLGYPGRTGRYSSSFKVRHQQDITLPISNKVRGDIMAIIKRWMDSDPGIRLKYSDFYFGLSNVQELNEGQVQCFKRFDVTGEKAILEKELQDWIDSDPGRKEAFGNLLNNLGASFEATADIDANATWYKETIIRACKIYLIAVRLNSRRDGWEKQMRDEYRNIDLRVERDIFRYIMEEYFTHVDRQYWGESQTAAFNGCGGDFDKLCALMWDNSILTDPEKVEKFIACGEGMENDPLYLFFTEVKITRFNDRHAALEDGGFISDLNREYTRALYEFREDKGIPQYPDANSTLRLTFGEVGGYSPRDGIVCDWKSSVAGILEKYNPDAYEYILKPEWKSALGAYDGPVNFTTDNDITGGNSGSPVLDGRGRLIGLAFDGNKESLAGDASFTEGYNKCVCVDIRYVLYILREYAHMDRILSELGQ